VAKTDDLKIILHAKIRKIYVYMYICVCMCVCARARARVCVCVARAQCITHTYIYCYMNSYLCRSCNSTTLLTIGVRRVSERIPLFRSTHLMRLRLPMFSRRGFKGKEIFSILFCRIFNMLFYLFLSLTLNKSILANANN